MIIDNLPKNCTGCGACACACPKDCLKMISNDEGFVYPSIEKEKCIDCGLCDKICPVLNEHKKSDSTKAFAIKNKDDAIRSNSSSGGMFYELASYVINSGGYVCAARYNENFVVEHYLTNKLDDIKAFQGAKYSQSNSFRCFKDIKNKLDDNELLLFVGTPCQVAGLKAYLKKDYENLILVDMICHGVPSPMVLEKYLVERQKTDAPKEKIVGVNQRSKITGWSNYQYSIIINYSNESKYQSIQGLDLFSRGFTSNLFLRKSCEDCTFKGIERYSDITLGDYWGIWNQHPDFDDNKGVSLALIHSIKGDSLFDKIKNKIDVLDVDVEKAIENNPSTINSSAPHQSRNQFFEDITGGKSVISSIEKVFGIQKKPNVFKKILNRLKG